MQEYFGAVALKTGKVFRNQEFQTERVCSLREYIFIYILYIFFLHLYIIYYEPASSDPSNTVYKI